LENLVRCTLSRQSKLRAGRRKCFVVKMLEKDGRHTTLLDHVSKKTGGPTDAGGSKAANSPSPTPRVVVFERKKKKSQGDRVCDVVISNVNCRVRRPERKPSKLE